MIPIRGGLFKSRHPAYHKLHSHILFYRPATRFSVSSRTMATEFKLRDLAALDMRNGEKLQVEVEGIEGGKVLLIKIKDTVHAMSANCTHFGAPLKNGVVTAGGRLTCPWHGACFNVATGDVEDAPALDGLAKYEIVEKDDGVYVKGDEATIKANRNKADISCSTSGSEKVVIVGGGSGTAGALEGLRKKGFKGDITCISAEGDQPYDRTKLSKALLSDLSKVALRTPDFYKNGCIKMVQDEVVSVDFPAKLVKTKSGAEHPYTKLVLATGGNPRWLPLDGLREGALKNVFVLRNLSHTKAITAALGGDDASPKQVVVVGSSFIGLEVANALVGKKHKVAVVGMESAPAELAFGAKVGSIFRAVLEKSGITFHMNASVSHATPSSSNPSTVGAVHLKDGTALPADLVICGVGVAPATAFLKASPGAPPLLKDGSLQTDAAFALPDHPGVFAIGDIATFPYHGPGGAGKPVRIEHWNVAQNAGRAVAATIAAGGAPASAPAEAAPAAHIPVFWSALGSQLRYCGNTMAGYDDVVLQGETGAAKPAFAAYYVKGDEVVAVATMGKDPVMVQAAELMRLGKMPSKKELVDGVDVMGCSLK